MAFFSFAWFCCQPQNFFKMGYLIGNEGKVILSSSTKLGWR